MKNILIVEDDINIQSLIEKGIHNIIGQANVKKAINDKQAMEISMETHIDIFVLDIELMGECNGMEIAQKLREIEKYRFSPIIFETSFGEHKLAMYENVGCQSFLIKPYDVEQVEETVKKAIDLSNSLKKKNEEIRIKTGGIYRKYELNNIVYIKSEEKYIRIVLYDEIINKLDEEPLIRYALKKILIDMNNENFIICHKSYIVNKKYIKKIIWSENRILLQCDDKRIIPFGDKYRSNLEWE